jgi:hypothetical protein
MELIAYGGAAPASVVFEIGRRVERGDIRDTAATGGLRDTRADTVDGAR